jgi:hypothetical protein
VRARAGSSGATRKVSVPMTNIVAKSRRETVRAEGAGRFPADGVAAVDAGLRLVTAHHHPAAHGRSVGSSCGRLCAGGRGGAAPVPGATRTGGEGSSAGS